MNVGTIYSYDYSSRPDDYCFVVITKIVDSKNHQYIAVGFNLSDPSDTRSIKEENWIYWKEVK
jgi:hypothetical protein